MKKFIFFCCVLALGTAKPNGYFHQEYSYKSSSSSYKNNELQHKKDDQGFYSKDGDLEGRVKPKVNSQSQHTEYTNPKLLGASGGYQTAGFSNNGANYMAGSDRLYAGAGGLQSAGAVDGYASSDRVLDLANVYNTRGYGSNQGLGTLQAGRYVGTGNNYGYTQGGSSYGYMQHGSSQSSSGSYVSNANLNALMQRLQDDMTRQLQQAIYSQHQSTGYSTSSNQMNADIRLLEEELKRNLTRQLQDSLRTQYGTNTYSIVEGRPSTAPDYSNQELAALTRRLEDDLISKLHQSVRTTYNSQTSNTYTSSNTYRPVVVYPATTLRPYYDRPVITTPNTIRYTMIPSRETISYPGKLTVETPTNIRYTPVPNPDSLTQIASRTQSEVNSYLDTALQNLYSTYLQADRTSYYTMTDFENEVNRIKGDILRNLTYNLDDQIRRNYGHQVLKNDYYYSVSTNGDLSTQSNYNLGDYESLKKQVEDNLLRKLKQTVDAYREQYQRHLSQYRESSSNTYSVTYRPVYYTSGNQMYDYSDLQRQMSQQLQNALNKHRYSQSSSYSASTSYNPQAYQTSLDELSRELQRNLTEQLSNFRASSSSSSSYGYSSGSGGNADFESMKNQLQNQLMQQLRQGLQNQHHYSASASYSASSSSSANANYGMRQAYSSYPTTCLHGCSKRRRRDLYQNSYTTVNKRHGVKSVRRFYSTPTGSNADLSSSPRYLYHPEELSYTHGMNSPSYNNHLKRHQELDPDIVEDLGITNHQTTPKRDDQQLEQKPYKYTINYAKQNELTQQLEETQPLQKINDDLSQQLEVGHRTTQKIYRFSGKLEDQNESTQQLEISAPGHHKLRQYEQELEGQLSLNSPSFGQRLEGQNTIGHGQKPEHYGQKLEKQSNSDQEILGQQLEEQNLIGNLHKPKKIDQELEGQLNIDQQTLGQQLEDQNSMGNLHGPKHDDQVLQGQDQQTLGQHLEDQNTYRKQSLGEQEIEGQLSLGQEDQATIKPRQHNQELVGQLHLEQQSLGQQLEDQNQMMNLHKPKRKHNFQEQQTGDDQNQLELTQKLEPDDLPEPKMDLGQMLEEQNQMINLHKPKRKHNFQEQQTGDDQNQLELTQKLEPDDLPEPKMDLGQQLEEQNQLINLHKPKRKHNFQEQQTGDDQNQLQLTQQLEPDDLVLGQQLQEIPTQELELGSVPKKRTNSDEKLEGSDQLMQQLETIGSGKPNYGGYAQQQSDIDLQSPDQQLTDLSQQLELTKPLYSKPSPAVAQLELKPVQKPQQQIENDDDLQQLELEQKPKHTQPSQQLDNDLTQQLEIEGSINGKTNSDQQLQNQEDLDQSLELIGGPAPKGAPGRQEQRQVDSPLYLQSIPKNTDQEQSQADDLTQQLEDLGKPQQQTPETDYTQQLILTNSQKPNLNQVQQQIEDSTGDLPDQLEQTNPKIRVQKLEHVQEQQQDLLTDQRLEEPEQKLELNGLSQTNIKPQKTIVNQEVDDGLSQQLELGDVQKPRKVNFANAQQQETDFTPLEFVGGRKPKPNHQYHPTLESELSLTPEKRQSENDLVNQPERSFSHHSQHSSIELNAVGQSKHYPSQTFRNYDLPGPYRQESEQRAFTNGHSGHFTGNTFPSLGSQVRVDSYENALKQQDALMDLLKEKVDSLGIYGKRTIKKTVFINGKPVETQESSQLIKPNGEVIPLRASPLPSKSIYDSPFGSAPISQSSNYFGENLRPTYHLTSPTFSGKTQLFTQGRTFEQNPSSLFETDLLNGGLRRESEFSGKTTRRVVHYVNGKPVSASEKIQITKPNGEIIEKNHELPTDQLNSLTHGFPNSQFEHGIHTLNVPQIQISSQIAGDSKQTIQRTHYVSSKLVGSSSQGVSQNEQRSVIEDSLPRNENNYSFGTKTSRHFGSGSY